MHEQSLIKNLIDKIHELAMDEPGKPIGVRLRLGALAHISASHLREHFDREILGTSLEGLKLEIDQLTDIKHKDAQEIILESLKFEETDGH
ncbi:hydrogenase maturation nickel metallochaperone HypA [Microbulbifer sp. OS29]|uniref:Hydrogenase maturation nickel metallochaperone HypA n=1 Tax=Microbulbifer okhotskensis TaxID=2926617 RepID=A0A9X2EPP2_9GAMM|nr:hydrogenase maturation nickel metallochaperone HypA [Microbulbifer okhotskensis]MCO1336107.1 hydrogenase maturation nickel metallochaperone HypA [Microbulbifer okhotskensis]